MTWYYIQKTLKIPPKYHSNNKFSLVAEYKINIQKNLILYINDLSEKEAKKRISFTFSSESKKKRKYLGTYLTKELKIYMLKTIKYWRKKLKKAQITPCSQTGGINIKLFIFQSNLYSMKPLLNSKGNFYRKRLSNPKIYMDPQKTLNSQSSFEKEQS